MLEITNLLSEVKILEIDCNIYLFGSYLYTDNWADLDVLIIYKSYQDIPIIKDVFSRNLLNTPLDLNFMTEEEENFYNFITQNNAQQIFPKGIY